MYVKLQNIADCDCFKALILPETSKILRRHQETFCAFSEVELLFQSVGVQEGKRQSHTVPQSPSKYLWTLVHARTASPLWNYGTVVIDILHSSPAPIGTEKPDAMRSHCEKHPKIRTKLKPPTLEER